jgi:L,D-transpeptidase ErfK/SrfK
MRNWKNRFRTRSLLGWVPVAGLLMISPGMAGDLVAQTSIRVDLSERQMSLIEDGDVVETYGVAVGRPSNPTPQGSFRTGRIVWNPGWIPPNSEWAKDEIPRAPGDPKNPMRGVKIYFRAPAYFIHGTNDPDSIGAAASRGCIRMREGDAKAVANWIEEQGGSVRMVIQA